MHSRNLRQAPTIMNEVMFSLFFQENIGKAVLNTYFKIRKYFSFVINFPSRLTLHIPSYLQLKQRCLTYEAIHGQSVNKSRNLAISKHLTTASSITFTTNRSGSGWTWKTPIKRRPTLPKNISVNNRRKMRWTGICQYRNIPSGSLNDRENID